MRGIVCAGSELNLPSHVDLEVYHRRLVASIFQLFHVVLAPFGAFTFLPRQTAGCQGAAERSL